MKIGSEYNGIYRAVNKRFGFVEIEENSNVSEIYVETKSSDVFLVEGDEVLLKITKLPEHDKKGEGKIIKVIKRALIELVGTVQKTKDTCFIVPDNKKITFDVHIENKFSKHAVNNHKVLVQIIRYPKNRSMSPEGIIKEDYGHKNEPDAQLKSTLASFDIPYLFTKEEIDLAEKLNEDVPNENNIYGRKDLRNLITFTVDSESAKDLDDAISLEIIQNGNYKLYVHIADVAHYIKEGSVLDIEALKRGNSVYLLDRVVPMLPFSLSNGACSLNPNEDKFTLTCEMEFDKNGKQVAHDIYESVINVNKRMSYNGVQAVFDGDFPNYEDYEQYSDILLNMRRLAKILKDIRVKFGSIDFNLKETSIVVDENLKPIEIKEIERKESNNLIEEFMLSANQSVAKEFYYRHIPFLYRTHEAPDDDKMKDILLFMQNLCYNTGSNYRKLKSKDVQDLLNLVANTEHEQMVSRLILRSMKQAKYTTSAIGHFGLAFQFYTHFTSPIRRYNDLIIHRIIKEVLSGEFDQKRVGHYENILDEIANSISLSERKAIAAERDIVAQKECEYLLPHVGEVFDAYVVSITNYGMYVALDNSIEGLVAYKNAKSFMSFDEKRIIAIDHENGYEYKIGDSVRVRLLGVNETFREIDFVIEED